MDKNEFTPERFEVIRSTLMSQLEHTPQNHQEAGNLLKTLAFKYDGDFDWMSKRIQGFKDLTHDEFLNIAKQLVGKQNKRRLAITMRGSSDEDLQYVPLQNPQEVRSLSQYKPG